MDLSMLRIFPLMPVACFGRLVYQVSLFFSLEPSQGNKGNFTIHHKHMGFFKLRDQGKFVGSDQVLPQLEKGIHRHEHENGQE